MLCILYVIAVGTCLGAAASLLERALPPAWPRRWIWVVAIALSTVTPPLARAHHTMGMPDLRVGGGDAPLTLVDADWWTRVQALDPAIERLWLAASATLIAWALLGAMRVAYLVRRSRRAAAGQGGADVVDGIRVVVTDAMGPATVGVWRSRVLVPRWVLAMPGAQRRYVLRHEEEHRRAHDGLLLCAASLSIVLLPWNVALWWQLRRLCLAVEVDCDRRVVAALGDAPAYGALLVRVAEAASRGPRLQPALLGRAGSLERRLRVLLAATPRGRWLPLLAPAAALALLLGVLAAPHPVARPAAHAAHGAQAPR